MASKLSENSEITIPLRNLVSLVAFTAVSVWVYFGLAERINFLEHTMTMTIVEVEENDDWIDDFKPSEDVARAVAQVHALEIKIAEILHRIETLEGR